MRPQTTHYTDHGFGGMDALTPAENLRPGQAQVISNFLMAPGGKLVSRSGFLGQLTSAMAAPIYLARERYVMPDGTLRLIFACNGKLYRFTPGGTSATEIKKTGSISFSFTDAANVRFAQWGRYVFLLDAGDTTGSIWRVDLGAGTDAISLSSLVRPTTPPVATASFQVLDTLAVANWAVDAFTGANSNLCANKIFTGADSTGSDLGDYWKIVAGTPKAFDNGDAGLGDLPAVTGGKWLRLDDPGDVVALAKDTGASTAWVDNGYATNASWSTASADRRYCDRFLFKCRGVKIGTAAKSFHVRLQFFSSAATPSNTTDVLYEVNQEVTLTTMGQDELVRFYIDVAPFIASSVRYIRLFLLPDPTSTVTNDGPYVTDVSLQAVHPYWDKPTTPPSDAGFLPIGEDVNILRGLYIAYAPGTAIVATGLNKLALTLSLASTVSPVPMVQFKFKDSSGNIWDSDPVAFGSTITVDITDMPVSMKAGIAKFAMVFLEDATIGAPPTTRTPASTRCAIYINDLVVPGNLSVGVPYSYLFSDFSADGTTYVEGGLESSGSPDSEQLTLTGAQGRVSVVLPSGHTAGGTHFLIWKRGGIFPNSDTRPRLAAMVPVGSNASGTGWSWDYATRTFTDNVADTDLWFADAYQVGRDSPPTGGRCLTVHASRLFVGRYNSTGKTNEIWASWILDSGTDAGFYFTSAPDPSDLEGEIKGGLLRERGGPGDRVQALVSMIPPTATTVDMLAAHLLILKEDSPPSTLTGSRGGVGVAGAFALQSSTGQKGGGCIAPQSAEFVHGVWWATATGLQTQSGSSLSPVSLALKPLLSLQPIGKARYSQVFTLWHDRKAWVLLPGSGSTDGVIYVWDELAPEGSRWSRLSASWGFVSAVSLSGGQDTGDMYLGGRDGQIYLYTGTVDKATPGGSSVGISLAITTRKYGEAGAGAISFYAAQRAQMIQMEVEAGASTTFTGTIQGDGASKAFSWAFASGVSVALIRGLGDVRGTTLWITLAATATTSVSVRGLALMATETSNRS